MALFLGFALLIGACNSAPTNTGSNTPTGTAATADQRVLTMPLAAADPAAFRAAEAALHHDGRVKAGLANLGLGAMEFAEMMDGTASFLLTKAPARMKAAAAAGGRLAAPLRGVPSPSDLVLGTYAMTTVLFEGLIESRSFDAMHTSTFDAAGCPCTKDISVEPTKDEVTVQGNKGTIFTTMSLKATQGGSKLSIDLKITVEGEVRDAKTGAVLYKISQEATGHADGDSCPDGSGIVTANLSFGGHEDYFDSSGAKTGSHAIETFGGQLRIKVDDNAKLAGVQVSPTGDKSGFMIEIAARGIAPAFENAWRSGMCIEVIVDPKSKDVEQDSVTTITAKVRHKFENTELDKPVEAKLRTGVKSVEPAGKQKAPATFKYTAGAESADVGVVDFESASNRGLGSTAAGYTVAGGWTISGPGASHEIVPDVATANLTVAISDLKIKADKGGALTGTGTMTLTGEIASGNGICKTEIDQTGPITAKGTLIGATADGVLKLTLDTAAVPGVTMTLTCRSPLGGPAVSVQIPAEGYADRWGQALGTFELPASGGTKFVSHTTAIGGVVTVVASATLTVVKAKK